MTDARWRPPLDVDEVEAMGRHLRFPLPDGRTQLVSRLRYIPGEPVPMRLRLARTKPGR